ncbi:MAG: transposase [Nanoarchaeota archaeon]|nr:transposase [Nanoarchaeota archaeon]
MSNKTFIRQNVRIYPNKEQIQFLNQNIGNQRFVWNHFLSENKKLYEEEKKFLFFKDTCSLLVDLKKENKFLQLGNSQALQQTLRDFDLALKAGYKQRKGFPKFKKKSSGGSFRLPQGCSIVDWKLKLPKIGFIKSKGSLPENFNSVTIIRKSSGKFYASFVVPFVLPEKVEIKSSIGIDLNSRHFVVLSDGSAIENPKFLKEKEIRLKRYQRSYSMKQKGSSNQNKARIKVAKQYEIVSNSQKNFLEQLTTNLVKTYDHISIEDLNVKAMQQFNGRMIGMAPFGSFRSKLTWKANKFGKHLSVINRFCPTSKVCSECGQELQLTLKDRWVDCDCGNSIHRDHNAAINIHRVGTTRINACGDRIQPTDFSSFRWLSLKQEAIPL